MSTITIGVNMNGGANGANRIRFEKLSERLQRVNTDILHKVNTVGALQTLETVPDSGELGCFFQDELEQAKKLETSKPFRKYALFTTWQPLSFCATKLQSPSPLQTGFTGKSHN